MVQDVCSEPMSSWRLGPSAEIGFLSVVMNQTVSEPDSERSARCMQRSYPGVTETQRAQPTGDHRPSVSRQCIVDAQREQCKPSDQRSQVRGSPSNDQPDL